MTLFEVEELMTYWAEHPPVHLLLAAFLGAGGNGRGPEPVCGTAAAVPPQEVFAALGAGLRAGEIHAGLGPAVLDPAELRRRNRAAESRG
jgi:hypothetical protein